MMHAVPSVAGIDAVPGWGRNFLASEEPRGARSGLAGSAAMPDSLSSEPGVNAMSSEHYDVIIIGTGAGGGTLAGRLAPSGKRVLLLERGGYLPREPENWDSREVFVNGRYLSGELWYDCGRPGLRAAPAVLRRGEHEVLRGCVVPAAG